MKRVVKLTEQDLYRIVKRVIKEQASTTAQPQAAATTQQPTSAFIQGVTRNANKTELKNDYIGLGDRNTGRAAIEFLLDGLAKDKMIFHADKEAKEGVIGIASRFKSMIGEFLEYTWDKKIDLSNPNNDLKLFGKAIKDNKNTYNTLTFVGEKNAKPLITQQDWQNIYNKLKEYQQEFEFPS